MSTENKDIMNEIKRIKYNFRENELKNNMNDSTLIDIAFNKTDTNLFNLSRPQPLMPLSVPIVIFSGIDPELLPRVEELFMKGVEMCNSKDIIYLNGAPNIAFHAMTEENSKQKLKDLVVEISNTHFT